VALNQKAQKHDKEPLSNRKGEKHGKIKEEMDNMDTHYLQK